MFASDTVNDPIKQLCGNIHCYTTRPLVTMSCISYRDFSGILLRLFSLFYMYIVRKTYATLYEKYGSRKFRTFLWRHFQKIFFIISAYAYWIWFISAYINIKNDRNFNKFSFYERISTFTLEVLALHKMRMTDVNYADIIEENIEHFIQVLFRVLWEALSLAWLLICSTH